MSRIVRALDDERVFEVPPPEIYGHEIEVTDPEMPGGAKILINAITKAGGRARATGSRAARIHGTNHNYLGMGDYVVVKFEHDGRRAVARWATDGKDKWTVDTAYVIHYRDDTAFPRKVQIKELRSWLLSWQGPQPVGGS